MDAVGLTERRSYYGLTPLQPSGCGARTSRRTGTTLAYPRLILVLKERFVPAGVFGNAALPWMITGCWSR